MTSFGSKEAPRVSDPTSNAYALFVWSFSALFFFYEFCLQSSPSVMVPQLMLAFHVDASQLGHLSAYYFYAYALMQLPVGLLLDRFGPRIMMTIACFICACGAFIFSHTHLLIYAELARFLMGIGSACAFISALKLSSLWFAPRHYPLLVGILMMFGMLGAIGGEVPLSIFVNHYGWRESMQMLSISGFILSCLFIIFVRNGARFTADRAASQINNFSFQGLKAVIINPQIWLMALYAALMFSPTPAFGELWGVPFIISTFSVSAGVGAKIISLLFIGWIIGSPLFGYLSDHTGKRLKLIRVGCWGSLIVVAVFVFLGQDNIWLTGSCLFLFGVFSGAFILVFTLSKEALPLCYAGTTSGFLNGINELVPGLLQAGMGMVLDASWTGKFQNGIRSYSAANYHTASYTLLLVIGLALTLVYFIRSDK